MSRFDIGSIVLGPPGTGIAEQTPFEVAASDFAKHLKATEGDSVPDAIRRLREVRKIIARWKSEGQPPCDLVGEIEEAVKR